jgi:FkbH-like protein
MSDRQNTIALLSKDDSTMSQMMQAIEELEQGGFDRRISIGLSSSVTVDLLGLYLRKHALMAGSRVDIVPGNYDDPIGDIDLFMSSGVEHMVLVPFFDNLLPSFEAQLETLPQEAIDAKEAELRGRYRIVFEKARSMNTLYLALFHRFGRTTETAGNDRVVAVLARYNVALREEAAAFSNIRIIDSEEIVRTVGQGAAFDMRFYFLNKAPYTRTFMNEFARRLSAAARNFGAHFYKVLVLDCDNTLWGGVIGEDLLKGVRLGPYDYPGNVFWRMQHEIAALERNGVLLCLCTKNNPEDVEEVLRDHPDMVLRNEQIVAKKVNWVDKPSNLRELADELNVGIDSFVFMDDSAFECEAVRQQLPMVKTVQVPSNLSDYPRVMQGVKELFLAGGISEESRSKTEQYRQRANAKESMVQFASHDEYLASLGIEVGLTRNSAGSVARISELSMKSNQFNLTTKRYSLAEIERMMQVPDHAVYSLVVSDKFGSAGLTGVVVMRYEGAVAFVENFLMSCRVIGRGVEFAIWKRIFADAMQRKCYEVRAEYIPTQKNAQVADFYDRLGMAFSIETDGAVRQYSQSAHTFVAPETPWITINYAE